MSVTVARALRYDDEVLEGVERRDGEEPSTVEKAARRELGDVAR